MSLWLPSSNVPVVPLVTLPLCLDACVISNCRLASHVIINDDEQPIRFELACQPKTNYLLALTAGFLPPQFKSQSKLRPAGYHQTPTHPSSQHAHTRTQTDFCFIAEENSFNQKLKCRQNTSIHINNSHNCILT